MSIVKGPKRSGVIQVSDPVNFLGGVTGAGGGVVQGKTIYVDNNTARSPGGNDNNTGYERTSPKVTIQSAIDQAPANSGSRIIVMGSGRQHSYPWNDTGFDSMTGADLYGVYREKIHLDEDDCGMQLVGVNYPFISGNEGATEDLTGYTPTVQIGEYGVDSDGPLYVTIAGFFIGGYGDDGDDAADSNRYGVGIAIGEYDDVNYNDGVYFTTIEDCIFRSSNDNSAAQTNDEEIHTWIKGWGNEKVRIRRCSFWGGQYQLGMMGSTNNQSMMWEVDDCYFLWAKTAAIYSSATPLACTIRNSNIAPQSTGKELALSGGTACSLVDCSFPLCASALDDTAGLISTAAELGTFTGWAVINGKAQLGYIYDKD